MKLTSYFYSIALLASFTAIQSAQLAIKSLEEHIRKEELAHQKMIDVLVAAGLEEIRSELSTMKPQEIEAVKKNLATLIEKTLKKEQTDQKMHGSSRYKRHDSI